MSVDAVHASRADALIVPLTSRVSAQRFGDHLLRDWAETGLPRQSLAKGVVETVDRATFGRVLGTLTAHDLAAVEQSLRDVLGL